MVEITTKLDNAAFLLLKEDTELVGFSGDKPYNCKIIIKTTNKNLKEMKIGIIDYRKYMKERKKLKLKIRKFYYGKYN